MDGRHSGSKACPRGSGPRLALGALAANAASTAAERPPLPMLCRPACAQHLCLSEPQLGFTPHPNSQAALAQSSRAWAAVSRGCRRLTARFDFDAEARAFTHRKQLEAQLVAPAGDLAGLASWLCQQQQAQQCAGGLINCLDLGIADECCLRLHPGGSLLAGTEARCLAQVGAEAAWPRI